MDESTGGDQQSTQIAPQSSQHGGHPPQPDPDEIHSLLGGNEA